MKLTDMKTVEPERLCGTIWCMLREIEQSTCKVKAMWEKNFYGINVEVRFKAISYRTNTMIYVDKFIKSPFSFETYYFIVDDDKFPSARASVWRKFAKEDKR